MMKDRLQLAWNGVELLLKKAEDSLAGTPFQVPIGIVNTLIELYNKATWKKILQNEQDKSQLNSIFKEIDEQIMDFQV
ncbi:hypothetical protein C0989_012513 [Termitomyces sp. Mn162]|nr:hypothetical protein C0989_012513 [Termitomyces sp. Mn162]